LRQSQRIRNFFAGELRKRLDLHTSRQREESQHLLCEREVTGSQTPIGRRDLVDVDGDSAEFLLYFPEDALGLSRLGFCVLFDEVLKAKHPRSGGLVDLLMAKNADIPLRWWKRRPSFLRHSRI